MLGALEETYFLSLKTGVETRDLSLRVLREEWLEERSRSG